MEETNFNMNVPWRYNINSWYNWTKYAGWQELHDHVVGPISYAWCGVHYVVFDKEKHCQHVFGIQCRSKYKHIGQKTLLQIIPTAWIHITVP